MPGRWKSVGSERRFLKPLALSANSRSVFVGGGVARLACRAEWGTHIPSTHSRPINSVLAAGKTGYNDMRTVQTVLRTRRQDRKLGERHKHS